MTATSAVEIRRDLVYARPDGIPLHLDLYLPATADTPPPIVLYLHGGAFMVGARSDRALERLLPVVREGTAIASAQYRFSDVASYPAQIHDVKAAVRWLRAHAGEHGYGAERVGAWGASAGGYLALMLGLTAGSVEHEGDTAGWAEHQGDTAGSPQHADDTATVDAVTAWFAPAELSSADAFIAPPHLTPPPFITGPPPEPSILARMLGVNSIAEHRERAAAASPATLAGHARGPFLLMHGDRDGLVSEEQSRLMHEALTAAGADSTLLIVAGANHEDPLFDRPAVLGAVSRFFAEALR